MGSRKPSAGRKAPSRKTTTSRRATKSRKADLLRDEVRHLVNELPDGALEYARGYLRHLRHWEAEEDEMLTPKERASLDRGHADIAAGRVVSHEEVKREFGW